MGKLLHFQSGYWQNYGRWLMQSKARAKETSLTDQKLLNSLKQLADEQTARAAGQSSVQQKADLEALRNRPGLSTGHYHLHCEDEDRS